MVLIFIYLFPDEATPWGGATQGIGVSSSLFIAGNFMDDPQIPVIDTPFISHEMGHVLGLWHTFHGTDPEQTTTDPNACPELPDGSNGEDCGDYISDTPADPNLNFEVNPDTCEWTQDFGQFMPSTDNFMAYTHPNCMDDFTTIQVQTMKHALVTLDHLIAVVDTECCATQSLDLFIKDSTEDYGEEPNTVTENMWVSEDIWIRITDDNGLTHQNPQYNSNNIPNYINVRVVNRSCETSLGEETLTINWAKANTALVYPENWDGTLSNEDGSPLGGELDSIIIPAISGNDDVIVKIPWVVPNPEDYSSNDNPWHFCLLATVLGSQDGLSNGYTPNPNIMVRNNNNQAWKNITIVDLEDGITSGTVMVSNPYNNQQAFSLEFVIESTEFGKPIYTEAEVGVEMDDALFTIWERCGKQHTELAETKYEKTKLIESNGALLDNLIFYPNERALLILHFNMLIKELTSKNKYTIHVIQKDKITDEVIGAETFVIYKKMREFFSATAGNDKQIDSDQTVTISPEEINEDATYNWYDPEGNLVYQGTTLTISAAMVKKYTLEVIADADGFKDYDEVEVTLKPSRIISISPNPVTQSTLQINYKLNNVNSAFLMIVNHNSGVSQNHILNTTTSTATINLNAYNAGLYTVALVCDNEMIDAKTFIKQ
jgi:hypothetical protein